MAPACRKYPFLPQSPPKIQNTPFWDRISTNVYNGSGTGGRCCICAERALRVHSPGGNTFLREMTSRPPSGKCDVKSKIRLCQSMRIFYARPNLAKFHLGPISNDAAKIFWRNCLKQQEKQDEQRCDVCEISSWSKNRKFCTALILRPSVLDLPHFELASATTGNSPYVLRRCWSGDRSW